MLLEGGTHFPDKQELVPEPGLHLNSECNFPSGNLPVFEWSREQLPTIVDFRCWEVYNCNYCGHGTDLRHLHNDPVLESWHQELVHNSLTRVWRVWQILLLPVQWVQNWKNRTLPRMRCLYLKPRSPLWFLQQMHRRLPKVLVLCLFNSHFCWLLRPDRHYGGQYWALIGVIMLFILAISISIKPR